MIDIAKVKNERREPSNDQPRYLTIEEVRAMIHAPRYLTRKELCQRLRISAAYYHTLVKRGIIKPQFIGRKPIHAEGDIPAILARLNPEPAAA